MNSRPYKQRYAYAYITGTEPEYLDCKTEVIDNPAKYQYKTTDYPCAVPRELDAYSAGYADAQISRCYSRLTGKSISHASKNTKLGLPDGALMLSIPGFIDFSGERTVYNVMRDCSIRVTKLNTSTGAIIKQETMSRGQFNAKYKIEETTTPEPTPEPGEEEGEFDIPLIGDLLEDITDEEGNLTKKGWIVAGGGAAALLVGSLVLGRFIR